MTGVEEEAKTLEDRYQVIQDAKTQREYVPLANLVELRPNANKIFLKNLINLGFIIILAIVIIGMLNFAVGLETFLIPFEAFGINLKLSHFAILGGIVLGSYFILMLIQTLIVRGNVKYFIQKDRIIIKQLKGFLFTEKIEILYINIVSVNLNKDGLFNKMFNSGNITFDLTGMKIKKAEFDFINNSDQQFQYIQQLVNRYKAEQQAQYTTQTRVDTIMDNF